MESAAYFCPECGAASIEYSSSVIGGLASCRICGWAGAAKDLLSYSFQQSTGTPDEAMQGMLNDMRSAYASSAQHFAAVLRKWGFIEAGPGMAKQATRYVAAMARASFMAIIQTREAIEKERVNAS